MISKLSRLAAFLSLLCFISFIFLLQADDKPADGQNHGAPAKFIRLQKNEKNQPIALEVAVVRYAPKDRTKKTPVVDLVTAVHIGEKNYYEQLNREFKNYDAVLYELVAPEGTRVPKGGGSGSGSFISMIQKGMKDVLELEFQLQVVDYTADNFVHADMSPSQFSESMKNRGESMIMMFVRMMLAGMAQQNSGNGASDAQLIMALFDKNRAMALKRIMAQQFQEMEGMLLAVEGPNGSTLIGERNKIALGVLKKQINQGKKKIAIFYGGGHMPDFDKRLREQFNLVPQNTRWLTAWNLKSDPSVPKE